MYVDDWKATAEHVGGDLTHAQCKIRWIRKLQHVADGALIDREWSENEVQSPPLVFYCFSNNLIYVMIRLLHYLP